MLSSFSLLQKEYQSVSHAMAYYILCILKLYLVRIIFSSLVKLHYPVCFSRELHIYEKKKSIKDLMNFCSNAFFKVFANFVSDHSKIWCSRFFYETKKNHPLLIIEVSIYDREVGAQRNEWNKSWKNRKIFLRKKFIVLINSFNLNRFLDEFRNLSPVTYKKLEVHCFIPHLRINKNLQVFDVFFEKK